MKTLILSKKVVGIGEVENEMHRFSRMVEALRVGGISAQHSWVETIEELKELLEQFKPDLVFNAAYAVRDAQGGQRIIHGLLDQEQIAYVGSDESGLALALSKSALKDCWKAAGILTPDYFVVRKAADGTISGLDEAVSANNFPYILKPSKEGNSRGISQKSIVNDAHTLLEGVFAMLGKYDDILVEKYLGEDEHLREFTVAMIGNQPQELLLPGEIVLKSEGGYRVITTADKDEHRTQAFPVGNPLLHKALAALADHAFQAAKMRDYARLDVLYSGGQLYAIEINGQPMVPDRWFEACARGAGLDTNQYLNAIVLAGIVRNSQNGHSGLKIPKKMAEILPGDIYRRILHLEKETVYGYSY